VPGWSVRPWHLPHAEKPYRAEARRAQANLDTRVPQVIRYFLLATVVLAATGCGPSNGGDAKPEEFAHTVCSGLLAWQQGVARDNAELSRQLQSPADLATVKAKYTQFFASAVNRTDTLLRTVQKSGAPKVDNGLGYARDLGQALAQTRTGLATARAKFAALPSNDLRSYAAGAKKIRDELGAVFGGVGRSLDRLAQTYPDKRLNAAFADDRDCRSLG